jgi:S1-C subfamily serine protease
MAAKNFAVELSDSLAGIVKANAASVVRVEARDHRPSSGIVWAADGTIVTASHTVDRDEGIEVALADGRSVPATLVGRDHGTDVAVLKADATGLAAATWGDLAGLEVGNLVMAIARPGRTARAASGIVSALGDSWRTPAGGRIERYLQTDLDLQPGFSGSVLADAAGRAIGMNTSGLLRGASLAVPAETLRRVAGALAAHGRVRRGFLGVGTYPVRLPRALQESTGQPAGLVVVSVQPDGPAEKAGVQLGDVVLSLDGERVVQIGDLLGLLDEERVGKEVTAKLARGGAVQDVRITVGARP